MSEFGRGALPSQGPVPTVPSQDGLRLIVAGVSYLLLIGILQTVATFGSIGVLPKVLPANALSTRDVVALFGWVGFMISGVSVIIVPNHLKVQVRPKLLPRLHFALANVGLLGFLSTSLLWPGSTVSVVFLTLVSASYLAFGLGVLVTMAPFLSAHGGGRPVTIAVASGPSIGPRISP